MGVSDQGLRLDRHDPRVRGLCCQATPPVVQDAAPRCRSGLRRHRSPSRCGRWRYVQVRRAYLDAILAYTHQLEHERRGRARPAVREERRRIARDLHDRVAHQLGIVSLHGGAARRWLGRYQGRTEEALAAAEQASRSA